MSRPKYMLTLRVGSMGISKKLRAPLGDVEGVKREMELFDAEQWIKALEGEHGGRAMMERRWNKEYAECVGHDHHYVSSGVKEEYQNIVRMEERREAFAKFAGSCKWLKISGCACPDRRDKTVRLLGEAVATGALGKCCLEECPIFDATYASRGDGESSEGVQ